MSKVAKNWSATAKNKEVVAALDESGVRLIRKTPALLAHGRGFIAVTAPTCGNAPSSSCNDDCASLVSAGTFSITSKCPASAPRGRPSRYSFCS